MGIRPMHTPTRFRVAARVPNRPYRQLVENTRAKGICCSSAERRLPAPGKLASATGQSGPTRRGVSRSIIGKALDERLGGCEVVSGWSLGFWTTIVKHHIDMPRPRSTRLGYDGKPGPDRGGQNTSAT